MESAQQPTLAGAFSVDFPSFCALAWSTSYLLADSQPLDL